MNGDTTSPRRASWRLRVYPMAVLVAMVGALLLATLAFDRDHPTSRLGGDYPSFYAAGSIAYDGDWDELYSASRQQTEQAGLIDDEGGYLYFSYPPFVAGAYAALGGLGYQASFLLHTVLMALALLGAIKLLWPWLDRLAWPPGAIFVAALASYPVLRAIPGGQNTTVSLLLLAAAIRLDHDGRPVLAGGATALLLFKPQFGLVLVALMLVARRWRMLAGWIAVAASLYVISFVLMGGAWIADWWDQARLFATLNVEANGTNFVSLPGFAENLAGNGSWRLIGYGVAALVGLAVAYVWWLTPASAPLPRFALAAAAVVVVAPQTLYYDTGLLLLGLVALELPSGLLGRLYTAVAALTWLQPAAETLGWSPLGPLSWVATGLLLWRLARPFRRATSV